MDEKLKSNRLDSIINRVCGDCGRTGAESNGIKLEGGAHTYAMGICDFCGEKKYLTSVRNFGYPDFNFVKNKKNMNRQEKIDTIYEKIASKKLTFGCSFLCQKGTDKSRIRRVIIATIGDDFLTVFPDFPYQKITSHPFFDRVPKNCVLKTIGHPVMIGDVMDYIENNGFEDDFEKIYGVEYTPVGKINLPNNLFNIWDEKRKPIEEQSDECVDFIYNLISKKG